MILFSFSTFTTSVMQLGEHEWLMYLSIKDGGWSYAKVQTRITINTAWCHRAKQELHDWCCAATVDQLVTVLTVLSQLGQILSHLASCWSHWTSVQRTLLTLLMSVY